MGSGRGRGRIIIYKSFNTRETEIGRLFIKLRLMKSKC